MATADATHPSGPASCDNKKKWTLLLNRHMIGAKVCLFIYGGVLGMYLPFQNIFFKSLGMSAGRAGFITGFQYVSSAIFSPVWGALADHTGRRKIILFVLCTGSLLLITGIPLIGNILRIPNTINETCKYQLNLTDCKVINPINMSEEYDVKKEKAANDLFCSMLTLTLLASVFVNTLSGYFDTIVMNVIKTGPTTASIGPQRTFVSIGMAISNSLGWLVADNYVEPKMSPYGIVFYMNAGFLLLLIPNGCYLVNQGKWENEEMPSTNNASDRANKSIKRKAQKTLRFLQNIEVIFFMVTIFVSGLSISLFVNFTAMFMEDDFNASDTEIMLALSVGFLSEILAFPFSSYIIKSLQGAIPAIIIGILTFVLRYLGMAFAKHAWNVIALQIFHSFGYALSLAAILEYLDEITSEDIRATVFGIAYGIFCSFSPFSGNLLGGHVYEHFGGRYLFQSQAYICLAWVVVMLIFYGSKGRIKGTSART